MFAWIAIAILPMNGDIKQDTVDCIERNRTFDECGKPVFVQWIGWNFDEGHCRHQVVFWRLDKPEFHFQERDLALTWFEGGTLRKVKARYWRETWTQCYDPEIEERAILPKEQRRGIFGERE